MKGERSGIIQQCLSCCVESFNQDRASQSMSVRTCEGSGYISLLKEHIPCKVKLLTGNNASEADVIFQRKPPRKRRG